MTERFASGASSARSIVAPSSIPDTVHAQIQTGVIFDITAALYGQITLKDGRVEQSTSIATKCCA